jgi:phospholipid-binding lipoprotein MlaA
MLETAIINTGRLVVNTTVGLLGTVDVANKMGFPKYEREDYGQTLGAWGMGAWLLFSFTSSRAIYN